MKTKLRPLLATLALILVPFVWAKETPGKRTRSIQFPDLVKTNLVAISLDKDIFLNAGNLFKDLRIKDSKGVVQSHFEWRLVKSKSETRRNEIASETVSAMPTEGGGFQIVFQVDSKRFSPPHSKMPKANGLRIRTPLFDFENRISVKGIDNIGKETPLAEGRLVDYKSVVDYRVDWINFNPLEFTKFKIVVEKPTLEQESTLLELSRKAGTAPLEKLNILRRPFRVDRVDFLIPEEVQLGGVAVLEEIAPLSLKISEDNKTKQTVLEFETGNSPIVGVKLIPKSTNFRRDVHLEHQYATGIEFRWLSKANGVFSRLDFQGHQNQMLKLDVAETRADPWRLVIDNKDSPPLEIEGLKLFVPQIQLVFMAQPGEKYLLEYGDPEAKSPVFDTDSIRNLLFQKVVPQNGQLGEVQLPTEDPASQPELKWILTSRTWFGVLIAVLGVILGITLIQAAKRITNDPKQTPLG